MRPKRDPVPRARDAWVWLGGTMMLGLLGGGVVAAAVLLWENVDIRQLTPALAVAQPTPPLPSAPQPAAAPARPFQAVFYESEANRDFAPDPEAYARELAGWRSAVAAAGGRSSTVRAPELLADVRPDEVLVLVQSTCLSPEELAAIRAHRDRGGSIVATWAVGARDGGCAWRGWTALRELTQAVEVREIDGPLRLHLTVPGGIALSPGLDPGTRIDLRPDPSIAVHRPDAHVYWSDWALNPERGENAQGGDVAVVTRRTARGGRVVWFGFHMDQASTARDRTSVARLARNGLLWAAGVPTASASAWPGGARAAMVFTLDVEDQWHNATPVARLFEEERIPGTFFVVSQPIQEEAALASALRAAGEIGSQTSDHTPLGGLTAQDQAIRMRRSWSEIERWAGAGPTGLRPPEELLDAATLLGWRMAGGTYVMTRNGGRTASPEVHRTPNGPVVLLPRMLKDDFNVIVQDGAIRSERIADSFVRGARKLHAIGGLAVVSGHTQIMDSPSRRRAYAVAARQARDQGDWWLARADDVARWWQARDGVRITFEAPADNLPGVDEPTDSAATAASEERPRARAFVVRVHGPDAPLDDVWIDVVLPVVDGLLRPRVDGTLVDFEESAWGVRIPVGSLTPGTDRLVTLFDTPPDPDDGRARG